MTSSGTQREALPRLVELSIRTDNLALAGPGDGDSSADIPIKNNFGQVIAIANTKTSSTPTTASATARVSSQSANCGQPGSPTCDPCLVQPASLPPQSPAVRRKSDAPPVPAVLKSSSRRVSMQQQIVLETGTYHTISNATTGLIPHPFTPASPSETRHVSPKQSSDRANRGSPPSKLISIRDRRNSLEPIDGSLRATMSPRQANALRLLTKQLAEAAAASALNFMSGAQNSARRTISPHSNTANHLRLPFFSSTVVVSRKPSVNANLDHVVSKVSAAKAAGPEGYLASLHHEHPGASSPISALLTSTSKRSTMSTGRKSSFFHSVKQVLAKKSLSSAIQSGSRQPRSGAGSLTPRSGDLIFRTGANQRASISQLPPMLPLPYADIELTTNQLRKPPPPLTVLSPSPDSRNDKSMQWEEMHSLKQPNSASSSPLSPLAFPPTVIRHPCVYSPGIVAGVYGQSLASSWNSSHHNMHARAAPGQSLDDTFIENWSESDDPLSPASFQEIIPGVYLGSAKSALNIDRLIQHRITHILTVMNRPLNFLAQPGDAADADILSFTGQASKASQRAPSSHPLFSAVMHALTFHFVYLLDVPEADLLGALDECLPFLTRAHQEERGHVLIHCQAGISRSASVVIAYVSQCLQTHIKAAFDLTAMARPYVNPNEGFITQLDLWYRAQQRNARRKHHVWFKALENFLPWVKHSKRGRALLMRSKKHAAHSQMRAVPPEAQLSAAHS